MTRARYIVANIGDIDAILSLTEAFAASMPDDNRLKEEAQDAVVSARQVLLDFESPFLRYRDEILGCYSTAERLRALVLHLWNDGNPVRLASLFGNTDERHTRIALELLASYTWMGEKDEHFMRLADEIRDLNKAEQARKNEREIEFAD